MFSGVVKLFELNGFQGVWDYYVGVCAAFTHIFFLPSSLVDNQNIQKSVYQKNSNYIIMIIIRLWSMVRHSGLVE